ncbi:hypothetical protein PRIPAC_84870 [Pristionchus pacificus]|uniref:Uncharacterized protein n=1 Tax=Pristionchus pacificus TaxID=54126 RepID=A0A2A6BLC9_PRIPA|nr:hypothetical protein PRIPAC_84870 [Pristionchus pacificus]|eukprot:PDM66715.1 hypothetical protein PRIPAC_48132 [Pristionchus pacificus]
MRARKRRVISLAKWDAFENGTPVRCSTCRSEGTFVQLNEEFVANIPDGAETEDSSDADDERALAEAARIRAAASAALDAASAASDAMQPVKEAFIRAQHALVEALRAELALERDGTCDEAHRTHRKVR